MATYKLPDGSPSWDGINPKVKIICGYHFGYHGQSQRCSGIDCKNYTYYSLHKRYKFSLNLEKSVGRYDSKHDTSRLYICSQLCFENLILQEMFSCTVPPDVAFKVLGV